MEETMTDIVAVDDPRYREMFDVRAEARSGGGVLIDADMNGRFNALRNQAPVHQGYLHELMDVPEHHKRFAIRRPGHTAFSFEACNAAFRDNETFSSQLYLDMPGVQTTFGGSILERVGEDHRRMRATVQPMFLKPSALTWWRQRWINDIVASLIEALRGEDRADLNLQLCARMPVHTVTRGVGIEGADALAFREALLTVMGTTGAGMEERMRAPQTLARLLGGLIARRRAEPGDDVVSGLIAAELELEDGSRRPLTDEEIMANCKVIILAGGGTTWRQLGITLCALLNRREQWEAISADRGLIEAAIDESVRWNPTDPYFSRLVTRDTMLDGVEVPAGTVLDICLGAANRDPARWTNPDAYDLHRPYRKHLGFSVGPHQCLGMHVAKAEMLTAISALIDHFPNLRLDPAAPGPQLVGALEGRGMTAVPVLLQ
jgi:cytochrome P450